VLWGHDVSISELSPNARQRVGALPGKRINGTAIARVGEKTTMRNQPAKVGPTVGFSVVEGPRDDWDAFVQAAPHGDLTQSSIWGLSKKTTGRIPVLIDARGKDGAILGGALMIECRLRPGIRVAYIARGPIVADNDASTLHLIIEATIHHARQRKLHGLIVQLPENTADPHPVIEAFGFASASIPVAPEATIQIDVTQTDESILSAMSSARRYNVRKSSREGFEIVHSDDVPGFHRLHLATSVRAGFHPLSLEYLDAQWRALAPSGAVTILFARFEGRPVAALWLSRFGDVVNTRLGGWDAAAPAPKHPNEALVWAAIQWARSSGARLYDLGGFDRISAECILQGLPLAGELETHNDFKLGFNGTPTLLPQARLLLFNRPLHSIARALGPRMAKSKFMQHLSHRLRG
jgi:lipid II:glycine glycyltransferase (peptidoglycan interpeptide bridge formation enzyme)